MKTSAKKQPIGKSKPQVTGRSGTSTIELPDGMWERISQKAHELWRARGYREGHALQDWLDAEAMVMEEIHEARE
ncbi:MAG: DUF2934 domain-containing protein [Nitrospira defluvii]|nr:DUF2934 domain-containing protein [Nitrospira defluvii]